MSQILFSEEDLVPISALADLVYCERRAALHHVEFVWEDNLFTVEGTHLHGKVDGLELTEVRGDIRIARGLRLRSLKLGLIGKADVVEFHRVTEDNTGAQLEDVPGLWQPMPVEYKRGALRKEEGYEIQLCAQALCLEEMLNSGIPSGAIYYGKTKRRLDIAFNEKLRAETEAAIRRLHALLKRNSTPQAVRGPKCERCSLIDICLPGATGGQRSAQTYLRQNIAEAEETIT